MQSVSVGFAVLALAAVLALIVGLGRLGRYVRLPFAPVGARQARRLSINAAISIDTRRRLVIAACDGREAVLLLGPNSDLLIGWLDRAPP